MTRNSADHPNLGHASRFVYCGHSPCGKCRHQDCFTCDKRDDRRNGPCARKTAKTRTNRFDRLFVPRSFNKPCWSKARRSRRFAGPQLLSCGPRKRSPGEWTRCAGEIRATSSALREMPREHLLMSVSGQGGTNPSIVSATRMFFASRVGRFSLVSRKLQAPSAFLFALRSWPLKARSWHLTKYLRR